MQTLKSILLLIPTLFLGSLALAQDEDIFGISTKAKNPKSESGVGNAFRNVIEQFAFELSTGAAYHQMGMSFYSENPSLYPLTQYRNFETPLDISPENPLEMSSGDWTFPLFNGGVRINLFNLLTIGGGYGMEWGNLSPMQGGDFEFPFEGASYQISKTYGTVGLVLYDAKRRQGFLKMRYRKFSSNNLYMQSELRQRARQIYPWRFILEGEFGQLKLKNAYDPALDQPNQPYEPRLAVSEDPYFGLGLRIERDFSEYTKLFIKGGGEFRSFTYASSDFSEFQEINQSLYSMQVGLAIRIPGTKRCKVQGCGVVMKHMHNGIEYRGSSVFNLQNRKVGQWY
ncbi:hypothetical protein [Algoriphagus confluentis]|uniref:Bacterial surface antigen (D15) domain-containing protein n=1 Tax=Algoriphagus confluentis TaxID=1697556 RepID=A0ABQ6PLG4_9BACT|nr:hypothetical protein Aconfl_11140 [Algoriphagus confluentis]